MRDFGSIQSPQNAYYVGLGLQSLKVRVDRHCASALQVARYLHDHPAVKWVHYPDLEDDPYHALQQKYLPEGSCGVMAICMKDGRDFTKRFMDHLQLITIETHVADAYTCVLHPASHTHRQLTDEQLKAADIDPGLVRLSVGLEDPEDLIADIAAAIEAARQ